MRKRILAALAATLLGGSANAVVVASTTFSFSGTCSDCRGVALGQLTLAGFYHFGDEITSANFLSFRYEGTDLLPAYTITSPYSSTLTGSITSAGPAAGRFFVEDGVHFFRSATDGSWSTGLDNVADYGTLGSYAGLASSAVPEPAGWALMLSGFGAIGLALRGRGPVVRFT